MSKPLRVLILSGGGSKGEWEAGVVDALARKAHTPGVIPNGWRLPWRVYGGVSTGALNAAKLVEGDYGSVRELRRVWGQTTRNSRVYKKRLGSFLRFLWGRSPLYLYDSGPLVDLFERTYSEHRARQSGNVLVVGATDLVSGAFVAATQFTPRSDQYILASAAYPVAFPPVRVGGRVLVDGGLRDQTPFHSTMEKAAGLATAEGYDSIQVDLVLASRLRMKALRRPLRNIRELAGRVLSITMNAGYQADILDGMAKDCPVPVRVTVYEPTGPLRSSLDFTQPEPLGLYRKGERDARYGRDITEAVSSLGRVWA